MEPRKIGILILTCISAIFLILGGCVYFFPTDVSDPHSNATIMGVFCTNDNNTISQQNNTAFRKYPILGGEWCLYDVHPEEFHECTLYQSGNVPRFNISQIIQVTEEKNGNCLLYVFDSMSRIAAYVLFGIGFGIGAVIGISVYCYHRNLHMRSQETYNMIQ